MGGGTKSANQPSNFVVHEGKLFVRRKCESPSPSATPESGVFFPSPMQGKSFVETLFASVETFLAYFFEQGKNKTKQNIRKIALQSYDIVPSI